MSLSRTGACWLGLLAATGLAAALPAIPPSHVVIVVEENHGFADIIGSSAAPYLNALARGSALMTRSFALTHPSEPNYLALFSGSTQGVRDDSCPHRFRAPNLGGELIAAGLSFSGYAEGLPEPGYAGCGSGRYVARHNPWVMFADVPAAANLPFSAFPAGHFQDLPTVAMVVPDLDHDMHDGDLRAADDWLQAHLDPYVQWARSHNSLLIVTFDEDDGGGANRIATLFSGPMVRPGRYGETIQHASVLRTLEDLYGLGHAGLAGSTAAVSGIWAAAAPAATWTVTASAGAHGSISPSGAITVAAGGNQTFNVDPAAGYVTSSVVVDGTDQGPICAYTFGNVAANHSILAAFSAPNQYTITASAGPGGSISPAGIIPATTGGSQSFSITPAAGYTILAVTVDGVGKGAIAGYTFSNILASHTISASFTPVPASGKVISIDFVGRGTAMAATEVAGVHPRSHWNAAAGAAQSVPQALVDETGAASGATVSWFASGVWSLPATGASNDLHMMSGYLDAVGANTIVRIAGLPANAAGYTVLVYADGDNSSASRSGIYQLSGSGITTTSIKLTDPANANFTGSYTQASNSAGNYVAFTVQASAFNLTAIPSASTDAYPRAPMNGIQIIPLAGASD